MSDFIKLEEEFLAHNLKSADFPGVLLLSEEDLSISTLANLGKNLEITLSKTNTSLAEIGSFSSGIFLPERIICFFWGFWRIRVFGFEMIEAVLTSTNIAQEVEVVIQEICHSSALSQNNKIIFYLQS